MGALALAQAPAFAEVDYKNIQFLGGTDKVDINNANVMAYRQFPGMYPTAAGFIASHGPYKQVADIYKEPGLADNIKDIIQKYERTWSLSSLARPTSSTASTTPCTAEPTAWGAFEFFDGGHCTSTMPAPV